MKSADAVSLTSCDSNDSAQFSTLPVQAPVPQSSSSSSTMSEDCSSESGQSKSPPLTVSIDLDLLRKEDSILELVSLPVEHSPVKLFDSDADSVADGGANGHVDDAADCSENYTSAYDGDKTLEIAAQTSAVTDDDFESIYSCKFMLPTDPPTPEISLDDAILKSLMTSHPDDFKDIVRPVSFCEYPESESYSENHVHVKSDAARFSIPMEITLPQSTRKSSNPLSDTVTGQSIVVNNWLQLPAAVNIRSLSVSSRHIWCVSMSDQMLYSQLRGPGLRWFVVTTAPAQQISISPSGSLVWRLEGNSAYAACNVSARQPWGNMWTGVARDVTWISVDDHVAW